MCRQVLSATRRHTHTCEFECEFECEFGCESDPKAYRVDASQPCTVASRPSTVRMGSMGSNCGFP